MAKYGSGRARRAFVLTTAVATAIAGLAPRDVWGADYQWDPNTTPATPSGGAGNWNTAANAWTTDLATDVP